MSKETNPALEATARIMYVALNAVFRLHDVVEMEIEGKDKPVDVCEHCSDLAEAGVPYPCPTARLLLEDMVVEPISTEKAPEEPQEPSEG